MHKLPADATAESGPAACNLLCRRQRQKEKNSVKGGWGAAAAALPCAQCHGLSRLGKFSLRRRCKREEVKVRAGGLWEQMWDPRKNVSEKWAAPVARADLPGRTCQGEPARARQAPAAKSRLAAVPVPADPALRVLPGTDEGCLRLGQSSACRKQLQNQPQLAGARWRLSDATRCRCPKGGPTASHRAVTEGSQRWSQPLVTSCHVRHCLSRHFGFRSGSGPWFLGPRDCQTRAPSLPGLACRNSTAAESRRAWRRRWGHLRAPRDGKPSGRGLTL